MYRDNFSYQFLLIQIVLLGTISIMLPQSASSFETGTASLIKMKLHLDPQWLSLLHYEKTIDGYQSQIDDPDYFISPNGKYNPKAELDATLQILLNRSDHLRQESFINRFPARYYWLAGKLNYNEQKKFEILFNQNIREILNDEYTNAYVVYVVPYVRNPESLFGHTLLRIESKTKKGLLSYSINYSAIVEEYSFKTIYKGATGRLKGYYVLSHYYKMLNKYSEIEDRDIWEYKLNLTSEEMKLILLHVLELNDIYSDYYFFTENCSYYILRLINIARPSLSILSIFSYYTIPISTIHILYKEGIIDDISYVPSLATEINNIINDCNYSRYVPLCKKEKLDIKEIQKDIQFKNNCDPLLFVYKTNKYLYAHKKIDQETYLSNISNLSIVSNQNMNLKKDGEDEDPLKGHLPGRLSITIGNDENKKYFEFSLRPAYHDMIDPRYGHGDYAYLNLLSGKFRFYEGDNDLKIESFDIVDLRSLPPCTLLSKLLSWNFNVGYKHIRLKDEKKHHAFNVKYGLGFNYKSKYLNAFYVLFNIEELYSKKIESHFETVVGTEIGTVKELSRSWDISTTFKINRLCFQETITSYLLEVSSTYRINSDISASLKSVWDGNETLHNNDIQLSINMYF